MVTNLSSREDVKTSSLTSIKSSSSTDSEGKSLEAWCFEAYETIYKSLIIFKKEDLLLDVQKSCKISFSDLLKDNEKLDFSSDNSSQSELTSKIGSLKQHNQTSGNLDLEPKLKELKDKLNTRDNSETEDWKTLKEWCKEAYGRSYKGDNENGWKLVQAYCKK